MYNYDSIAKRTDYRLRSELIGLETAIYKGGNREYIIVICEKGPYTFDDVQKTFGEIHPAAEAIFLTSK